MLKNSLIKISIFVLLFSVTLPIALSANNSIKTIELVDLMNIFLLPEGVNYNLGVWSTGADGSYPIKWLTNGVASNNSTNYREGKAIVTVNHKYLTTLKQNVEPAYWDISLEGYRGGYKQIEISCFEFLNQREVDAINIENQFDRYHIPFTVKKLHGFVELEQKVYTVKFPKRKTCWVLYNLNTGSGGMTVDYKIYLDQPNTNVEFMK